MTSAASDLAAPAGVWLKMNTGQISEVLMG
jgi:hypothetical protein